jgi:hypothetical protein
MIGTRTALIWTSARHAASPASNPEEATMNDTNTCEPLADSVTLITAEQEKPNEQPKTSETYAHEINVAWRKAVDSTIEAGRILLEAKEGPYCLKHGAFEAMVRTKLPFNESTARKLMAIARHPVLSNRSHVNVLPPSYGTLYALTKVPNDRLIAYIREGTINPKLERKDVAALRDDQSPKLTKAATPSLREENANLKAEVQRLRDDHAGDVFSPNDTPADIARVIVEQMRGLSNDKADKVLQEIKKLLKLQREAS